MSQNAAPQSGDLYLQFNGIDAYVEIPSIADYSLATTGALTVAAWIRPNTLNFPNVEPDSDYIHWLGKGDQSGSDGNQEWTFRMYNYRTPLESLAPTKPDQLLRLQPAGWVRRRQLRPGQSRKGALDACRGYGGRQMHVFLRSWAIRPLQHLSRTRTRRVRNSRAERDASRHTPATWICCAPARDQGSWQLS